MEQLELLAYLTRIKERCNQFRPAIKSIELRMNTCGGKSYDNLYMEYVMDHYGNPKLNRSIKKLRAYMEDDKLEPLFKFIYDSTDASEYEYANVNISINLDKLDISTSMEYEVISWENGSSIDSLFERLNEACK